MADTSVKYTDVFVPGGFPRHTYNPRLSLDLERKVGQVSENLCKLVTVTGHTKSGKTVLVRQVLPPEGSVWIDGGQVGGNEEDFWQTTLEKLDLYQSKTVEERSDRESEIITSGRAGAHVLGIVKAEGEIGGKLAALTGSTVSKQRTTSSKSTALRALSKRRIPLIVDDFHYLPRSLQATLIRTLKPLVFDGVPVVVVAIPHRRYDAIRVEKEMTGRVIPIEIPPWSNDDLSYIPVAGFRLLGTSLEQHVIDLLCEEAIGSPHLMQDFCRGICEELELDNAKVPLILTVNDEQLDATFRKIADGIGKPIFEKLARGPRQRADRKPRGLKDGRTVDIYRLVLHALASLKPALVTLEYEDLRSAIRAVSADQIPQLQEVARVLKHMSDIASTDESSSPVIDFEEKEKRLHVTDPFFAFYLRRGNLDE